MTQRKRRPINAGRRETAETVAMRRAIDKLVDERERIREDVARALDWPAGLRHPLDAETYDHSSAVCRCWGDPPPPRVDLEASARVQEMRMALERAAGVYDESRSPYLGDFPEQRTAWRAKFQRLVTPAVVKAFLRYDEISQTLFEMNTRLSLLSGRPPWE